MSYPALAGCVAPGCSWWLLAVSWLHWLAASCVLVLGDTRSFSPRTRFARARASVAPLLVLAAGACGCARVRALPFLSRGCSALFTLHSLTALAAAALLHSATYTLLYSATLLRRCSLALALRYPLVLALALIARH